MEKVTTAEFQRAPLEESNLNNATDKKASRKTDRDPIRKTSLAVTTKASLSKLLSSKYEIITVLPLRDFMPSTYYLIYRI